MSWLAPAAQGSSYDRVVEPRRAVALARHFRETEGLSIAQIAHGLERSPATIKAYFYDPTGGPEVATEREPASPRPRTSRVTFALQPEGCWAEGR